ncbi:BnaA04g21200D [Brassica napus]|uniref:BnaA04g21200D protein n=1 Tax=Brassica napus TaxID=3708 RepID=A0A078G0E6_BRANA|nr:BnaA04g21200D [Brassica napus]
MSKVCRGWNFTSNHSKDADGRIILIWKDTVAVRVLQQSRQSVTCEVKLPGSPQFVFTAIYAENERADRNDLWVELLSLYQTYSLDTVPWILGGDFNQIIHPAEHSLPEVSSLTSDMVELRDCFTQMGIYDLRFQGSLFTWSNHRPEDPITKKLDRLLINNPVLTLFPNCSAFFHPTLTSDHCPCTLDLATKIPAAGNRPFKFYNYLTKHPSFNQVVIDAWTQAGDTIQALNAPSTHLFEMEKQALQTWNFLRGIEESYFRQRSRVNWLKEGDQNTTFFFRMVQTRMNFNFIRSFLLSSGVIISDPIQMSVHAVTHFQQILGPSPAPVLGVLSTTQCVQKSSFFASGLSTAETDLIQFSTGMPMGALPVRYLGVPLCTKKLSMLHCEVLMQQIKSRLSSWSTKSLSFAGRLLLIKTVITGIMTFWCSTFILPQACVKRINSLCGVFLWKGDIEEHHSARVILGWGLQTSPTCVLCNCFPESRNHLFFDCHYAWSIWGTLASRCGFQPERSWDCVLGQLQAQSRNSLTGTLLRLCWQACIYWTWTERNGRLHRQTFRTPESVSRTLVRQITDRISSLRDSNPAVASSLMQQWLA